MTVKEFCEHILKEDNYVITCHEAPDGDAIGSEIVLFSILNYLNKKCMILNSDPTEQKYKYMDLDNEIVRIAADEKLPFKPEEKILIVLDTEPSNIGHLGTRLNTNTVRQVLVVDHHDYEDQIPFEGLFFPNASSTCEILYDVQQHCSIPFFDPLTEAMFTGIVYDTGSFIYPKTSARTFEIAHQLVLSGARPNFVYSNLYESKSTASLKLRSMVGNSLELFYDNHVAYQYMDGETLLKSGATYEESQEIVNIPLQSNDVRVSIFVKENEDGKTRCSIRTKNEIDCLPLASRFGGGGHPTAAGFKLNAPWKMLRPKCLHSLPPFLHNGLMIRKLSLLLTASVMLFSCKPDTQDSTGTSPRIISPRLNDSDSANNSEAEGEKSETNYLVPMIDLPEDEYVQKIQDSNLDEDSEEEQIILTRVSIEDRDLIRLYIADYDNDKVRYRQALVQDINAQQMEGLSIHLQDLTGNQLNELYITGFTDGGFHTMDAFAITSQSRGLEYKSILSLSVNGTVDIQTVARSEAYKNGERTGESFPIITEETSTEDDDNLDLVKTIYNWSSSARKYQPFSVAKIPGVTIKEEKLKKLYRGDLNGFKAFLTGPWHRVSDLNRQEQPFLNEILYFYPDQEQLIFTVDDIQEIYSWKDTYRTIFKGIYIQSTNILINSIRRDIYITVEDMDSIRMKIQGTTEWGGFYEPVSPALQQELIHLDKLES